MAEAKKKNAKTKRGIVYVITNHYMPGLVKIGRTRNLPERLGTLNTAVPQDFEVRCAALTPDAPKLEADMHQAFKAQGVGRENSKRSPEFFRVPFEHAVSAMELAVRLKPEIQFVNNDHSVGKDDERQPAPVTPDEKTLAAQDKQRFGRISFGELDVPDGATLDLVGGTPGDPHAKAVVVSDSEVEHDGKRMSLSKAAREAKGYSYAISGVEYWEYKGEILSARRKRLAAE